MTAGSLFDVQRAVRSQREAESLQCLLRESVCVCVCVCDDMRQVEAASVALLRCI